MLEKFKIKIFADGADLENIKSLSNKTYIKGFTNPSLMRKKVFQITKILHSKF